MVLCSQAIPCKSCKCCAPELALAPTVMLAPTVLTTSPPDRVQWFQRTKVEYTSGYYTEARLKIEAKPSMDDDAALATFQELRRLERRFRAPEKLHKTRCKELRPIAPATRPFPFLELPAEVRMCIYEYALQEPFVQRLRNFVTPALARTSAQLRQESLPVWFAINTFVAELKSSFLGLSFCSSHGTRAEYISENDTRYRRLGNLDLDPIVTRLLATCPPRMIRLRNLDFCMKSADSKRDRTRSDRFAVLSVRDGRPVRITAHVGGGSSSEYSKHVHHVFESGRSFLEQLVSDPDYQGLYMLHVKDVAAAFRVKPLLPESPPEKLPPPTITQPARQDAKLLGRAPSVSNDNGVDWVPDPSPKKRAAIERLPLSDDFELPHAETYFS
ncbi:hypothetical protein CERZMDRAFT_96575 [Cercospora zeae-maydis SCOH1-5]|uniref:F-box domain-containing protein n=1 Tax=Cercospora zeae-maydis SCOH1-5 TaxID=717836 RepID=A0A6A6FK28_9PEZI|nr:hypothetical protein CERZMDRAFT_96575 [Cercospora zeae-maydis SCOH1-5]